MRNRGRGDDADDYRDSGRNRIVGADVHQHGHYSFSIKAATKALSIVQPHVTAILVMHRDKPLEYL